MPKTVGNVGNAKNSPFPISFCMTHMTHKPDGKKRGARVLWAVWVMWAYVFNSPENIPYCEPFSITTKVTTELKTNAHIIHSPVKAAPTAALAVGNPAQNPLPTAYPNYPHFSYLTYINVSYSDIGA